MLVDDRGEAAQQPGPVGGGRGSPAALGGGGAGDGGVDVGGRGGRDGGHDLFGRGVQYLVFERVQVVPHMRSKERRSSQSVTAES